MSERSVSLYLKEGSSDKVYQVHLRARDGAWAVDFANGRRGAALRTGTKTSAPISLELALQEFERLVASKKKGGDILEEEVLISQIHRVKPEESEIEYQREGACGG